MKKISLSTLLLLPLLLAAGLPVVRQSYTSPMVYGPRKRVLPHAQIYARIQPYDLYSNYLHEWIDRPLYHSRDLRDLDRSVGFERDCRAAKEYGIAGFTMLGNSYATRYRNALNMLKKRPVEKFKFMAGMSWHLKKDWNIANARMAINSPLSLKFNGKTVLFPYLSAKPGMRAQLQKMLDDAGAGNVALLTGFWPDVFAEYTGSGHKLSPQTIAAVTGRMKNILQEFDGMVITDYHMHRDSRQDYPLTRKFYYGLNRDFLADMTANAYAAHPGKLLGYDVRHGYIGFMSGTNEAELGTSQFRHAMDGAMLLNPDLYSLVEWNEANENTSFQPTVLNSRSFQRLVRYYADFFNALPPTPNPGDDLSIPNLVIAVRRTVPVGEKYRLEVLNIPDGSCEKIKFRVHLSDERSQPLWSSGWETLDSTKLSDITYTLGTEHISTVRAVNAELEVDFRHTIRRYPCRHTRIESAHSWDLKEILMPLRDMMQPTAAAFAVTSRNGTDHAVVKLHNSVDLRAVEILDRDREVFTFGEKYDRNKYTVVTLNFAGITVGSKPCRITVEGSDKFHFQPWGRPYSGFGKLTKMDNILYGELLAWHRGSTLVLLLPPEVTAVNFELEEKYGSSRIVLDELKKKKHFAAELKNQYFVRWDIWEMPYDHPYDLKRKNVEFSVPLPPREYGTQGVYHLRAIDENGKIYRSQLQFCGIPEKTPLSKQNVFSAAAGKVVTVDVPSDNTAVVDYQFTPEHGNYLAAAALHYLAMLGNGRQYAYSMNRVQLPAGARTAPAWEKLDARWVLRFDGVANYIAFPMETIPAGEFKVTFSCLPENSRNMTLLSQSSVAAGGLQLYIVDGKLFGEFTNMGKNYQNPTRKFATGLRIENGKWNEISVTYDLRNIVFSVNDKTQSFPCSLRPGKITTSVFGMSRFPAALSDSSIKVHPFQGLLRSYTVVRGAVK